MLTLLDHPLVHHWLAELRDVETEPPRFRSALRRLSVALFLEAARDLPLADVEIRTPLVAMSARRLAAPPVLVPVLRAGLGMVEPILELLPECRVAHLGYRRDHVTLEPVTYYRPERAEMVGHPLFVLDPMLATGGTAVAAIREARSWGATDVRLLAAVGAPPGVERVERECPGTPIYLAALDPALNDVGYIVPGLGDAGDRQFGT
jgi:uracil phosphoribosyltransferase